LQFTEKDLVVGDLGLWGLGSESKTRLIGSKYGVHHALLAA